MFFGFLKSKFPKVERRKEPRYGAEDEFVVEFKENASVYAQSRDISVHGVRFASAIKLKCGKKIDLNFRFPSKFPGPKEIRIPAKVVRAYRPRGVERYRIGCSLLHESEITKEALRQFIEWLNSR